MFDHVRDEVLGPIDQCSPNVAPGTASVASASNEHHM